MDMGQMFKAPRTPSGKHTPNDPKARKSPKKHSRRGTSERVFQKAVVKIDEASTPSPDSVKSVVERLKEDEAEASGGVERPGTAVRTPEPRSPE